VYITCLRSSISVLFYYHCSTPNILLFSIFFYLISIIFCCGCAGSSQILESTYDFSVTDSNSLLFLFKHSPEVAKELNVTSEFSFQSASFSKRNDWMVSWMPILLFASFLRGTFSSHSIKMGKSETRFS